MIIVKRCKLPLSKQKLLLNLFIAGCTARAAAPIVSVNRETAKLFFRKLRKRLYDYHIKNSRKLNGIVEIDECYTSSGYGGRKAAKQGRNLSGKIAIVGAVERVAKQVILTRVFDTKESTLRKFAAGNVRQGATVFTDAFRAYSRLRQDGFKHHKVNHFLTFKDSKTGACTNLIESFWASMRRHLYRFCGGHRHNLNFWLSECALRFQFGAKFAKILKLALKLKI